MGNILKTYTPSGTDETLCGEDFKGSLNKTPVFIYLNGKYYVLECVVCNSDKTVLIAGNEKEIK